MESRRIIKKNAPCNSKKVFQHFLLQAILKKIHEQNMRSGVSISDNPDGEPKKIISQLTGYSAILRLPGIQEKVDAFLLSFDPDSKLSIREKRHLNEVFIWNAFEEIIEDESNNLLYKITEVDQGYPNPLTLSDNKAILLCYEIDSEAVDEWFRIQGRPNLKIYNGDDNAI
jgi:hypothetical protein